MVERQELFFSTLIPFKDPETGRHKPDYGRLVIELQTKKTTSTEAPKLDDFVTISDNQKAFASSDYEGYNVINQAN